MSMQPVKIGGELFWANWMKEFNKKFDDDNNKYECTICNLSDKASAALEELGIKIKENPKKPEMGKHIVGKSLYAFEPVDEDGKPVDISKIGNGTKVTALVSSYRHKMSAKYGAAPSIKKLIVTELKEYNPEPKEEEELDDVL